MVPRLGSVCRGLGRGVIDKILFMLFTRCTGLSVYMVPLCFLGMSRFMKSNFEQLLEE